MGIAHPRRHVLGLGLGFALLAAVFKAGKDSGMKAATLQTDEYVTSWAYRAITVLGLGLLLLVVGGFLRPTAPMFWVALVINSLLLSVTTVLMARAFMISDVSIVAPIGAVYPILVAIPSFFILSEVPSALSGVGIVLVAFGAYILNLHSRTESLLQPFRELAVDRGAQLMTLSLVIAAFTPSLDKIGIRYSSPEVWAFYVHLGMVICLTIVLIAVRPEIEMGSRSAWGALILVGGMNILLWITQNYAYMYTQVAYVQAIKRGGVLLTVLAGWVAYGEVHIRERFVGAVVMVIGVAAIIFGA